MTEQRTEHKDGWYQSLTDEVSDDAEFVHIAVNPSKGNPTIEAGTLESLGIGLARRCKSAFEIGRVYVSDDTSSLYSVYVPGPAWGKEKC